MIHTVGPVTKNNF